MEEEQKIKEELKEEIVTSLQKLKKALNELEKLKQKEMEDFGKRHHPKSFLLLDEEERKVILTFCGEIPDLSVLKKELNKAKFYPKKIEKEE